MPELRNIGEPRRLIIGTRGQVANQVTRGGGDTNTQHLSRVLFSTGPYPVTDIKAHYWWGRMLGSGLGEGTVGNGATVEAAFEGNSHAGRRLYFDGASSKTVLDGMLFETEGHPEAIAGPYSTGFIRTLATVTAGQFWPLGSVAGTTTSGRKSVGLGTAELLGSGAPASGTLEGAQFCPIAVTGKVWGPAVAVAVLGCSLEDDTGDTRDAGSIYQPAGYVARGLIYDADGVTVTSPIPYAKLAMGSETLASVAEPNTGRARMSIVRYATDLFIGALATNHFSGGGDLATAQAQFSRIARHGKANGARVWAPTTPPRCTGSFSAGAALAAAGQTYLNAAFAPGGAVDQFDDWVKSGAGGLIDGYFDLYALCVDPANPRKWRSDYIISADGVHLTQAGYIEAGKSFSTWARANMRT